MRNVIPQGTDVELAKLGVLKLLDNAAGDMATQWLAPTHLMTELSRTAIVLATKPYHNRFRSTHQTIAAALNELKNAKLLLLTQEEGSSCVRYGINPEGKAYLAQGMKERNIQLIKVTPLAGIDAPAMNSAARHTRS